MNRDKTILMVISREISVLKDLTADLDRSAFIGSEKDQRAVIMTLLNIGEKVKQLTPAFKLKHHEIRWKQISGLRDIVAHTYFKLDMNDIWNTVQIHIPEFEIQIQNLFTSLD